MMNEVTFENPINSINQGEDPMQTISEVTNIILGETNLTLVEYSNRSSSICTTSQDYYSTSSFDISNNFSDYTEFDLGEFLIKLGQKIWSILQNVFENLVEIWRSDFLPELFHRIIKTHIDRMKNNKNIFNWSFGNYFFLFRLLGMQLVKLNTISLLSVELQKGSINAMWISSQDIEKLKTMEFSFEDSISFHNSIKILENLRKISEIQYLEQIQFEKDLIYFLDE